MKFLLSLLVGIPIVVILQNYQRVAAETDIIIQDSDVEIIEVTVNSDELEQDNLMATDPLPENVEVLQKFENKGDLSAAKDLTNMFGAIQHARENMKVKSAIRGSSTRRLTSF